jgi:phosphoserine phosphatase
VAAAVAVAVTTKSRSDDDIPIVTASALVRELASCSRGALAFDGDGTLWRGDVGEDFYFGVLDSGHLADAAASALLAEARKVVDVRSDIAQVGRELYAAYNAGRVDEILICEIMTWINAGWTEGKTRALVDTVIDESFAVRIHPEVHAVIRGARELGHEIFVVSASPRPIVEAAAAFVGVPRSNVIAATSVLEGDRFIASVHRPIPYGAGKASALATATSLPLLAAFGDNAFDEEMLRAAERPIAVRPKARLVARAAHIPNLRRLAVE